MLKQLNAQLANLLISVKLVKDLNIFRHNVNIKSDVLSVLKYITQDSISAKFIQLLLKVYIFIQYISAVTVIKYIEQI